MTLPGGWEPRDPAKPDFPVGTVIVKEGTRFRYEVLSPTRTSRGKLRIADANGGIKTTWWEPGQLPRGYAVEGQP